ncbi:Cleavage and polyadenylation specificity factor subunit 3 [Aphelenchoides bicaudatus]|nr:Cleavage and polyadenylation specificity factor subunit 3 [Aphelenchoides bicaudatus]
MLPKLLILVVTFLLTVSADDTPTDPNKDPKMDIYKILTSDPNTNNDFPVFQIWRQVTYPRIVYFQGFGDTYGTKCPHIYQLDVVTLDISLYSTGLGYETHSSTTTPSFNHVVTSTLPQVLKRLKGSLKDSDFDNNILCPTSLCSTVDTPEKHAMCDPVHIEHFPDEAIVKLDKDGLLLKFDPTTPQTESAKESGFSRKKKAFLPWREPDLYLSDKPVFTSNLSIYTENSINGEVIRYTKNGDDRTKSSVLKGYDNGAYGGLFSNRVKLPDNLYFFHGYNFTDANREVKLGSIKKGIVPQTDSRVYYGKYEDLINDIDDIKDLTPADTTKDYVYPTTGPDGKHIMVTVYDRTTQKNQIQLLSLDTPGEVTKMSADAFDSSHAFFDLFVNYTVFSSTRYKNGNQLLFGIYTGGDPVENPQYFPEEPHEFKTGMLMYVMDHTGTRCPQIFQINPDWKDVLVRRKMTSGIHAFESPNFIDGSTDILYAGTLTKAYAVEDPKAQANAAVNLCPVKVCSQLDPTKWLAVKDLCTDGVIEKSVPPESELYISNTYGSIKQRVTKNSVYDGEASVYGSKLVIYSSYDTTANDFDLYQLDFTDKTAVPTKLTQKKNSYGFEGGVAFSPNGKLITYYAHRPETDADKDLYKQRMANNFVDVSKSNIYVYNLDSATEYQITSFNDRAFSPIFVSDTELVFLRKETASGTMSMWFVEFKCDATICISDQPEKIEEHQYGFSDMFYQPDKKWLTFSSNDGVFLSTDVYFYKAKWTKEPVGSTPSNNPSNPTDPSPGVTDGNTHESQGSTDSKQTTTTTLMMSTTVPEDDGPTKGSSTVYLLTNPLYFNKMAEGGESSDVFTFMPLGSGQEFDCGIHPGMQDFAALPFVDLIDAESLDLLLITHFHLDHCGALPWFLNKTGFRGRCFMTQATKSIYRMLLGDYIKMSNFHEQKEVNGIKFWPYVAGHVLGAAMFMIEIAGIRALYTGDFSVHETRHLCGAEVPSLMPDILIAESTCGTQVHESREQREKRFTSMVHDVVSRGGRCLIPVFAVGPAQELMLILDEYWEAHPELRDIPIYYASALAKKCMSVYQTFSSGMNRSIQKQIEYNNPFVFKHVSNLKSIEHFEDSGPCVVLASPDAKNGCVIAGYCVEGTLARHILSEPEEIVALAGHRLPMRLQVLYISFSAHADYSETSNFVHKMKPAHLILVHGEMNEMNRLKAAILRQYEDTDYKIEVHNPRNTETLSLFFRGQKTAKIVGQLAENLPPDNSVVSGILLRRNFNYHLLMPSDLSVYTELSTSTLTQKKSLYYDGELAVLVYNLGQLTEDYKLAATDTKDEEGPSHIILLFEAS